ncbi:hypothetical protein XELAEV_18040639mg [Xenopus laevis]|uniref:Uncharacterized protein n=1 Tax=Xenopus laevis TaxID=8355 RepID=A0A974CA04_XENLA|nr:hypothetical protein XELAEV_18040639mg [Xenopus laevis]
MGPAAGSASSIVTPPVLCGKQYGTSRSVSGCTSRPSVSSSRTGTYRDSRSSRKGRRSQARGEGRRRLFEKRRRRRKGERVAVYEPLVSPGTALNPHGFRGPALLGASDLIWDLSPLSPSAPLPNPPQGAAAQQIIISNSYLYYHLAAAIGLAAIIPFQAIKSFPLFPTAAHLPHIVPISPMCSCLNVTECSAGQGNQPGRHNINSTFICPSFFKAVQLYPHLVANRELGE